jgi:HEAT repeat protein
MVVAALFTAVVATLFTGVTPRLRRRVLAVGVTITFGGALLAGFVAFRFDARAAYGIYLLASAVEILALTHAWDYIGDLLTGRQAKRLVPLLGAGSSMAAVVAGFAVGPLALALGSEALLWLAASLLGVALLFLWRVREPVTEGEPGGSLIEQATLGFRSLVVNPLLLVLAGTMGLLMLTGTLVDFQWKLAVQSRYQADQIAVVFGLLEAGVGAGALAVQVFSSRVLFPRLGVSTSSRIHAGTITAWATASLLSGSFLVLAILRLLDDVLEQSIQKATEQVSLLPFPTRVRNAAFTILDGVLKPMAQASAALLAFALVTRPDILGWVIIASASAAFLVVSRHARVYLAALEEALSKHLVDFKSLGAGALALDRTALVALEKGLYDPDPTVVVFSLSLLEELPPADTAPMALPLLEHKVPEVRAAAVSVLGAMASDSGRLVRDRLVERLDQEDDPQVLDHIISALGVLDGPASAEHLRRFVDHPEPVVRKSALTSLAAHAPREVHERIEDLLHAGDVTGREVGLEVVGRLGDERFLPDVTASVTDPALRTTALKALGSFGVAALPALDGLLARDDLPFPVKRSLVTTLAGIQDAGARGRLLQLVSHSRLGPAALTSLKRLRAAGDMERVPPSDLRPLLRHEVTRGARYALLASALGELEDRPNLRFVASEVDELRIRHIHRVLAVLTLGYEPSGLSKVGVNLFATDASRRSNALEYLEGSLEPEDAALAVPLAEFAPGEESHRLDQLVGDSRRIAEHPLEMLAGDDEWWPRALAAFASGPQVDADAGQARPEEEMLPIIERVMLLKGSDLFRNFPGEELAGIAELTEVVLLQPGETLFEQGDRGDAYFLVVSGGIRIIRDGHELALLGAREGFGEMAILDQETRSATARASDATALLRIDRDSFDQLVERNPAVARGIYRVLTQRLRSTLARVAAGG